MGSLPFEQTRYDPVQETTPEEAEKNKRQQTQNKAAMRDPKTKEEDIPSARPDKAGP